MSAPLTVETRQANEPVERDALNRFVERYVAALLREARGE